MEYKMDLRVIKTRKALYNAFTVLLNERSFEDITVNELCEKALVRRATFYKHFADKYDFFAFFIRDTRADFEKILPEQITTDNFNQCMILLFQQAMNFFKENKTFIQRIMNSNAFPTLVDIFAEEITRDILLMLDEMQYESFQLSLSGKSLASFYSGGIVQVLRLWLTNSTELSETQILQDFSTILASFTPFNV